MITDHICDICKNHKATWCFGLISDYYVRNTCDACYVVVHQRMKGQYKESEYYILDLTIEDQKQRLKIADELLSKALIRLTELNQTDMVLDIRAYLFTYKTMKEIE